MSKPREWWILKEEGSNRALLRNDGEKWDNDVNGEPRPGWIRIIEYAAYAQAKSDDAKTQEAREYVSNLLYDVTLERDQFALELAKVRSACHRLASALTLAEPHLVGKTEAVAKSALDQYEATMMREK